VHSSLIDVDAASAPEERGGVVITGPKGFNGP
jgi:hypothetical protein